MSIIHAFMKFLGLSKEANPKKVVEDKENTPSSKDKKPQLNPASVKSTASDLKKVLSSFEQNGWACEDDTLRMNMQALKDATIEPLGVNVELRFNVIMEKLGEEECYETVRQDRWQGEIQCPRCKSKRIKRIDQEDSKSKHNFKYKCVKCKLQFNDDSDTPFEKIPPSLEDWMRCWYLMSCTTSPGYIAAKLNLDLATIKEMMKTLQRVFKSNKPLEKFMQYKQWSNNANHYEQVIKQDIIAKKDELLNAERADSPKDTREYERQRQRRRNPTNKKT